MLSKKLSGFFTILFAHIQFLSQSSDFIVIFRLAYFLLVFCTATEPVGLKFNDAFLLNITSIIEVWHFSSVALERNDHQLFTVHRNGVIRQ